MKNEIEILNKINSLDDYFLNELSVNICKLNSIKGFWDELNQIKSLTNKEFSERMMKSYKIEKVSLAIGELSESIEALRKNKVCLDKRNVNSGKFEDLVKDTFEDEIADAIIRLLDLCGMYNIDINWHIKEKLKYNTTRPYKHGKLL